MKKKILSGIFTLALLITAGYGVSKSVNGNADLSLLTLSNVEALANGEGGGGGDYCNIYCKPAQGWKCTVYVNGVPWLPYYDYRKPQ